jgi:hypothetical protein
LSCCLQPQGAGEGRVAEAFKSFDEQPPSVWVHPVPLDSPSPPAPVQAAAPALSADDCHGLALEAASWFEVRRGYIGQYLALPFGAYEKTHPDHQKRAELKYKIDRTTEEAKAKATEYVAHPQCTADLDDMRTILK